MTFGDKIKKLRQEKGWNQEYVAQQLNISVPALSRYESGTYEPKSLSIISDFAKLYDVTTDYLLGLSLEYDEEALKDVRMASYNGVDVEGLSDKEIEEIKQFVEFVRKIVTYK